MKGNPERVTRSFAPSGLSVQVVALLTLEADEEVDEVLVGGEGELATETEAGAFDTADGEVGEGGDLLGGEIETEEGAELQIAGGEGGIALLEVAEEVLVDEVEVLLVYAPELEVAFGLLDALEEGIHLAYRDVALLLFFLHRFAEVLDDLFLREDVHGQGGEVLGFGGELGLEYLTLLLRYTLFLFEHDDALLAALLLVLMLLTEDGTAYAPTRVDPSHDADDAQEKEDGPPTEIPRLEDAEMQLEHVEGLTGGTNRFGLERVGAGLQVVERQLLVGGGNIAVGTFGKGITEGNATSVVLGIGKEEVEVGFDDGLTADERLVRDVVPLAIAFVEVGSGDGDARLDERVVTTGSEIVAHHTSRHVEIGTVAALIDGGAPVASQHAERRDGDILAQTEAVGLLVDEGIALLTSQPDAVGACIGGIVDVLGIGEETVERVIGDDALRHVVVGVELLFVAQHNASEDLHDMAGGGTSFVAAETFEGAEVIDGTEVTVEREAKESLLHIGCPNTTDVIDLEMTDG